MNQKSIFVFDQIEKTAKDKTVRKDSELSAMLHHFSDTLEQGADYRQVATKLSIAIAQYRAIHHFQLPRAIDDLYKQLVRISGRYQNMPTTINNWIDSM